MISGCVRIPGKINIYQSEMFSGIQSNFLLIAPTAVFFPAMTEEVVEVKKKATNCEEGRRRATWRIYRVTESSCKFVVDLKYRLSCQKPQDVGDSG